MRVRAAAASSGPRVRWRRAADAFHVLPSTNLVPLDDPVTDAHPVPDGAPRPSPSDSPAQGRATHRVPRSRPPRPDRPRRGCPPASRTIRRRDPRGLGLERACDQAAQRPEQRRLAAAQRGGAGSTAAFTSGWPFTLRERADEPGAPSRAACRRTGAPMTQLYRPARRDRERHGGWRRAGHGRVRRCGSRAATIVDVPGPRQRLGDTPRIDIAVLDRSRPRIRPWAGTGPGSDPRPRDTRRTRGSPPSGTDRGPLGIRGDGSRGCRGADLPMNAARIVSWSSTTVRPGGPSGIGGVAARGWRVLAGVPSRRAAHGGVSAMPRRRTSGDAGRDRRAGCGSASGAAASRAPRDRGRRRRGSPPREPVRRVAPVAVAVGPGWSDRSRPRGDRERR